MDAFVLTLAIRWLPAVDALAASCACREWNRVLASDEEDARDDVCGNVWKQVCQNTNKFVVEAMEASSMPSSSSSSSLQNDTSSPSSTEQPEGAMNTVNYRRLALGLGRSYPIVAPRRLQPPTLGPQDVFAVVDLYRKVAVRTNNVGSSCSNKRRRVIEASWVVPSIDFPTRGTPNIQMQANNDVDNRNNNVVVIHGANPYSLELRDSPQVKVWQTNRSRYSQKSPLHFAAHDIVGVNSVFDEHGDEEEEEHGKASKSASSAKRTSLGNSRALRARVTLFRKDNLKSVCVLDENIVDCATGGDDDPAEEVLRFHYINRETLHFANDGGAAGQNARLLAQKRSFSRFSLDGEFVLKAVLPSPGDEDEPMWLANSRHAVRTMRDSQVYIPNDKDKAALSLIKSFAYQVKRFNLTFRLSTHLPCDFWDEFDSQDDLMIAIEGLCWQ